jgi:hypothetical protein
MLFDLQLKCVVSDGLTPAPVLPVVALIWTSVFKSFAASGNKSQLYRSKTSGFAMYSAFGLALVQETVKRFAFKLLVFC